ncbi:anthranilate synthase component I family protein [Rhodopirellula bahusiensis]|uniref:Aminodeoxychorismate/anthranilate synthase component I n=1 Tax=Rhodopirellula bahusiensis TaxID=2014065 RepID=A0A2G1W3T9_9BACT|nr:anthranilate synthase component I family protein [Rhodopirellula bahusiensis]PHQ33683.1 aminodeoxychorismate/anthranilate synthase component I [Rhodopirellula bahusiensis]
MPETASNHSSTNDKPETSLWTHPLGQVADLDVLFKQLAGLEHRLWLDSVSDHEHDRGRYSFLTADPVGWLHATLLDPDPWPQFHEWCSRLPLFSNDAELPPFCGGLAGLVPYEAAWWLEPSVRMPETSFGDHPPLGMAIGIYDWTIALDHSTGKATLICNGLNDSLDADPERARVRGESILQRLRSSTPPPISGSASKTPTSEPTGFETGEAGVRSNFDSVRYVAAVAEIIDRIGAGDSFQVNLAQTLTHEANDSAEGLYRRLRQSNPAPYAAFFDLGSEQILSSSPEGFLQIRDRHVVTRPIKGTVPRTGDEIEDERLAQVLGGSVKDRAENIMIVDLMRNDLSIACTDDSVRVTGLCEIERYQSVQHLVSTVEGELRDNATISELLAACFPGGSITGAPKIEAMKTIARLEGQPREAYCGSMGYVSVSGNADFNILIRTVTQRDGQWHFAVGGGITARSEPQSELEETWTKAAGLLRAIRPEST